MKLPYWNLDSIFPGLDSPEFVKAKRKLDKDITRLETFCSDHDIRAGKKLTVSKETLTTLNTLLDSFNRVSKDFKDLRTYLYLITSTDSFNDKAQAELSKGYALGTRYSILNTRFTAWLGRHDAKKLIQTSKAKAHQYGLEKDIFYSKRLLGEEAEELFSSLRPSSSVAWAKLHDDLTSRATIKVKIRGTTKAYTVAELKSLNSNKDAAVRKTAFEAERELLAQHEVSFTAAMNSIKGQVNEVSKKRGWESGLEQALFVNSISAKSLEAMQQACREAFPVFRRYLKAKAKFMGKSKLPWYDLFAPLSVRKVKSYDWQDAQVFIVKHFRSYSDQLADFAKRSFDEGWHDVPPRKGKTGGAYCAEIPGRKESRIMHNYTGSLDDLFTVAHELGHAYHNDCMYRFKRTSIQSSDPVTLAETASIFCETIVVNALLEKASDTEKLAILEQDLQGATQLVVDIYSRFILEKTVFDKRLERELSTYELKTIMLDAQRQTYGDALSVYHDLMWAQKGHYYIAGLDFYNFPYTFGYLFALGLYAEYTRQPEGFHERYDVLLASTGMTDASTLARGFGIDIESVDFWRGSLSVATGRVKEFENLVKHYKAKN